MVKASIAGFQYIHHRITGDCHLPGATTSGSHSGNAAHNRQTSARPCGSYR